VLATQESAAKQRGTNLIGLILIVGTIVLVAIAVWWTQTRGAAVRAEDIQKAITPPRLNGTYPCVFADLSGGTVMTGLGQCATPTEHPPAQDRVETDLRYGAFTLRQADLAVRDGFDVPLTRAYSSGDWAGTNRVHAFGVNSNHSFDFAPLGSRRPYAYMTLMLEDSDFLYFKRISQGKGFADAVFLHTETATRFYKSTIAWNGNGWTLQMADGSEMQFPEAYLAKNMAQCAPYSMKDATGQELVLRRDAERHLEEVRTPRGRWIRFRYDSAARIVEADDDAGSFSRYSYNSDGLLTHVMHSSGGQRTYEYAGRLMTAVIDEQGRTLVRNQYKSGRLTRQLFANGDLYAYDYRWTPGKSHVNSVVVTLPNGTQKELDVES